VIHRLILTAVPPNGIELRRPAFFAVEDPPFFAVEDPAFFAVEDPAFFAGGAGNCQLSTPGVQIVLRATRPLPWPVEDPAPRSGREPRRPAGARRPPAPTSGRCAVWAHLHWRSRRTPCTDREVLCRDDVRAHRICARCK
jgi:hypothetical protein